MLIIIIFILVLYYYFFVSFKENIKKPIVSKVVDFENNLYENGSFVKKLSKNELFDYDSQQIINPFQYSIKYLNNKLIFNIQNKTWEVELTDNYYWNGNQIYKKDECFGKGNIKMKATKEKLFEYIQENNFEFDITPKKQTENFIFNNVSLFYFDCENDKIKKLNICPTGHYFKDQECKSLDICVNQQDGYKYADILNIEKYYECENEVSIHKHCPSDEIFEHDKCTHPQQICLVKPEGYRFKINRTTIGICRDKKSIIKQCFKNKYVLNNNCEWDVCENKDNEIVPFYEFTHFPFAYYASFGKCIKGKLTNVQPCSSNWDKFETDVNLTELPKVFDIKTKKCEIPKLCENVKLIDSNAVVPAWYYQKHLATWNASVLFDRTIGYNCDSNNILEKVNVEYGYLIKDYKLVAACKTHLENIPTRDSNIFYNCKKKSIDMCSPGFHFNGKECTASIPNSFKFENLDVFKFNELKENNWIQHRLPSGTTPPKCENDEILVSSMCVHEECKSLSFIRELKRPIKIDNNYQCVWDEPKIKKVRYDNPYGELNFWTQNFLTEAKWNPCIIGSKVQTGNFVLDSTLHITCRMHQPFVFCPSTSTVGIEKVGTNLYACKPKNNVYSYKLPAEQTIKIILNELDYIFIPKSTWYNIDNQPFEHAQDDTSLYKANIVTTGNYFVFKADHETIINYKILANNPPNSYIKNQRLQRFTNNYNIIADDQTTQPLTYNDYTILSNLDNFNS